MTDDELHAMWVSGASLSAISRATGRRVVSLGSRIRRLREREGEARWPKREGAVKPHSVRRPPIQRAGASTLPPLPSLTHD